ncbi:DUF3823 domain-containing protein [Zunongwangia sp. HGR-M22]|uniref:DUF3823 domain-containing protein n=1 Tax=Zunongwangia sp. HGR-M22 TaxID=3015168 RepID=UPI0022DD21E8|nr:DUF3823 domain-containing protein [Zunongwangia sp. HGR-M22]WBL25317.1 DUF3823 domain-containing protein [Zunongwangia sp. HGR-M22]
MKKRIIYTLSLISISFLSCEKDNFDAPGAMLEGQIMYQDLPISVRTNSAELELWQDGYALNEFIPVFIAQDGTYSVSLFDGEYKMVRKGGDPWLPQLNDTIVVQVNGNTQLDVPVTPYVTITNESFQLNGQQLNSSFQINQIVENSEIQEVLVILDNSILLDKNINTATKAVNLADFDFDDNISVDMEIPENLRNEDYIFVRIGARSSMSNELIYTNVQKIEL